MSQDTTTTNPRSGFNPTTSTFHSKRQPIPLPPNPTLDITTFISSRPHRGTTAFIDASTGHHLSYSTLYSTLSSLSHSLSTTYGVRKGHVILLLSPNSLSFPLVCLSVMSLGAVITTANPLNTTREVSKQLLDSKPFIAFTTPDLMHKLNHSNVPVILLEGGHVEGKTGNSSISTSKVKVLATLDEVVKQGGGRGGERKRVKEEVRQDDVAALLYSSGTTGVSKGVVSSHGNMIAMVQTIIGRFGLDDVSGGTHGHTFVCTVPMFHVYGLVAFATGTKLLLLCCLY